MVKSEEASKPTSWEAFLLLALYFNVVLVSYRTKLSRRAEFKRCLSWSIAPRGDISSGPAAAANMLADGSCSSTMRAISKAGKSAWDGQRSSLLKSASSSRVGPSDPDGAAAALQKRSFRMQESARKANF